MAVTYVSGGASSGSTSVTAVNVPFGTGLPTGGIWIAAAANSTSGATWTAAPVTWTSLYSNTNAGSLSDMSLAVWWKLATGSESGNFTATASSAGFNSGVLVGYKGTIAAPINATVENVPTVINTVSPTSGGALSPAPASDGMVVRLYFWSSQNTTSTATMSNPAAPWNTRQKFVSQGSGAFATGIIAADQFAVTSTATSTASVTGAWAVVELWLKASEPPHLYGVAMRASTS